MFGCSSGARTGRTASSPTSMWSGRVASTHTRGRRVGCRRSRSAGSSRAAGRRTGTPPRSARSGTARRRSRAPCACPGARSRSSRGSPRTAAPTSRRPWRRRLGRPRSARARLASQTRGLDRLGDRGRRPVEHRSESVPGRLADGEHRVAACDSCGHQTLPFWSWPRSVRGRSRRGPRARMACETGPARRLPHRL